MEHVNEIIMIHYDNDSTVYQRNNNSPKNYNDIIWNNNKDFIDRIEHVTKSMKKKKVTEENELEDEDVLINSQGDAHDPLNINDINDRKEENKFTWTNDQKSLLDAVHDF